MTDKKAKEAIEAFLRDAVAQHLSANDLAAYSGNTLGEAARSRMKAHLDRCLICSLRLKEGKEDIEAKDDFFPTREEYEQANALFRMLDQISEEKNFNSGVNEDSEWIPAELYREVVERVHGARSTDEEAVGQAPEAFHRPEGTPANAGISQRMGRFHDRILPLLLWLVDGKWFWGNDAGETASELKQVDGDARVPVGGWRLQPAMAAVRSWGPAGQPISMSTSLPEQAGEITVIVRPERQQTIHRDMWNVRFELAPSSRSRFVDVGIGTSEGCTTGTSELREQRPVEFTLTPPKRDPYWIYFEWPDGEEINHHRLELPIRSAREDAQ